MPRGSVWKGRAGSDMPRLFFHAFLPRVLIRRLKVSGRKDEFFHSLDGWIEIDDTVSIFPPAPTTHSQRMWTVPEDRFQIAIVIGRLPKLELPSMRTEHGGPFGVTPLTPHHSTYTLSRFFDNSADDDVLVPPFLRVCTGLGSMRLLSATYG
jgi:hypothetical protein